MRLLYSCYITHESDGNLQFISPKTHINEHSTQTTQLKNYNLSAMTTQHTANHMIGQGCVGQKKRYQEKILGKEDRGNRRRKRERGPQLGVRILQVGRSSQLVCDINTSMRYLVLHIDGVIIIISTPIVFTVVRVVSSDSKVL